MVNNTWCVVRVDASLEMGSGHLMRCLTLAKALQAYGYRVYFLSASLPAVFDEQLKGAGISSVLLESSGSRQGDRQNCSYAHSDWLKHSEHHDIELSQQAIAKITQEIQQSPALIIVDHYALAQPWESALGQFAPVLAIDDLNDRHHSAHWLLDQTVGKTPLAYQNLVKPEACLMIGGRYALLRPEFALARERAMVKRRASAPVQRIMLSLGGADQHNVTGLILQHLNNINMAKDMVIDVIVGAINPHIDKLRLQCEALSYAARLAIAVDDMAERMLLADICIGAAGATAWERCATGLPSINVVLADNQRAIAENLSAAGAAFVINNLTELTISTLSSLLQGLINQVDVRMQVSEKALELCDGRGVQRVVEELLCGH